MAENQRQRIHPVVVGASSGTRVGAPPPPGASAGTRVGAPPPPTQKHRPTSGAFAPLPPPPLNPPKRRRSSCWCKCISWTFCVLLLLIIIVAATAGIIYLIFQPKVPNYSIDDLKIADLTLNFDLSLSVTFNVRIIAYNPNKKIGIYYEKGSHLSAWYKNTNLCQGSLPRFYQGQQNRTVLHIALTGQNQYGRTILEALQEQQQTGRIPLDLKIDVPVSIKLGMLKLKKVRILGSCLLIVDRLSANSIVNIKANSCKLIRLKL